MHPKHPPPTPPIRALPVPIEQENERLRSLESMLDLARKSMTQEQFARVTGMSTATGMATAIASSSSPTAATGGGGGSSAGLPAGVTFGA